MILEASWFEDIESLASRVRRWGADVLHLHSFWLWPIAQALRGRLGLPLVYTVHSLDRAEYELGAGPPQCIGQWVEQQAVDLWRRHRHQPDQARARVAGATTARASMTVYGSSATGSKTR